MEDEDEAVEKRLRLRGFEKVQVARVEKGVEHVTLIWSITREIVLFESFVAR